MARPRKYHKAKRTASGRLSRAVGEVAQRTAQEEREAMEVAVAYRQNVWHIPAREVTNQKAGSFIGRLRLANQITETQYDALQAYEEAARANRAITPGPKGDTAFDPNRVPGISWGENEARDERIRARYRMLCEAVQERQNELRQRGNLFAALYECVQQDKAWEYMVGDLREAANAIARRLRMVEREVA